MGFYFGVRGNMGLGRILRISGVKLRFLELSGIYGYRNMHYYNTLTLASFDPFSESSVRITSHLLIRK